MLVTTANDLPGLLAVILYVLSLGPGQYICARQWLPAGAVTAGQIIFLPLAILPPSVSGWIERYADWFAHALP